jgi:hypothetical protein
MSILRTGLLHAHFCRHCRCCRQLDPWWLVNLLGTKVVEQVELAPGEVLIATVPEGGRHGAAGLVHGAAVVVGYDRGTDNYRDTTLSPQRVAELVTFANEAPDNCNSDDEETRHGFEAA